MIILASTSSMRHKIMGASKLLYTVKTAKVDERLIERENGHLTDEELVLALAKEKASALEHDNPNDLIIAADTFAVTADGTRLHKPDNADHAMKLCLSQSDACVKMISGVAMRYKGEIFTKTSQTLIKYVKFDRATVEQLLAEDDATIRNAALGSFIDAPGFTLVESFEGSYTGAFGLPMEVVREGLVKLGYSFK